MPEISQFQYDTFVSMGIDVSGFTVPPIWSDPVRTHPDNIPDNAQYFAGFEAAFQGGPDGFDAFQGPGGPDGFDLTERVLDFGFNGTPSTAQSSLGGFAMVTGAAIAISRMGIAFNLIGRAIKTTNGRIPLQKGFLSRIMQVATGATIAQVLGIDLWPFNNSSERDQVQDIVEDALENGAISDNRAYNRSTGMLAPLRAIIILYDRMGEQVEQMYAVSFRPVNGSTASRRAIRGSNVVRRRRTPQRRSR